MINSVKVTTKTGKNVTMELREPEKSGFLVRNISGVTDGAVDVKATELTSIPGSIISGTRKGTRNIVFDLTLLWKQTVEEMRHECSLYFPIGEEIRLDFSTETRNSLIRGVVESVEPIVFDSSPHCGIDCQISIQCADPRFYTTTNHQFTVYDMHKKGYGFHMPFGIAKHTETQYPKPVGVLDRLKSNIASFTYDGTVPEGLVFSVFFNNTCKSVSIKSLNDGRVMTVNPVEQFIKGDVLRMSTKAGQKSVLMYRNGNARNYLDYYDIAESKWIQIYHGQNSFEISIDGGASNANVTVMISYTDTYWSV